MLIRPPHGNHGGQNMASGSASAYTTLGSSPMSCSSTAASHTEQSSLRHPPSSVGRGAVRRDRHHARQLRRARHHRRPPRVERVDRGGRRDRIAHARMPPREHRLPGHAEQDRPLLTAQVEHVRHQTEPRLPAVRTIRTRERRAPRPSRRGQASRRDPRRDARGRRRAGAIRLFMVK